jgi:hypothetical protein
MPERAPGRGRETHEPDRQEPTTARTRGAGRSARVAPSPAELALGAGVHGNRDLARLARAPSGPRRLLRTIRTIRGERVSVHGERQAAEAATIIDTIETTYGIDIDSRGMVAVVRGHYSAAPGHIRRQVTRRHWKLRELRALLRACRHYARILGDARTRSSRHAAGQEVTQAGKLSSSINDDRTALHGTTLGEYFRSDTAFAMYRHGEDVTGITGDVDQELEFTATHELAHGLMNYALPNFVATMDFWLDRTTPTGIAGAEAPPTNYGQTNAAEDMCETMAMYFMFPDRLRTAAPVRYRWARRQVRRWRTDAPAPAAPAAAPAAPAAAGVRRDDEGE